MRGMQQRQVWHSHAWLMISSACPSSPTMNSEMTLTRANVTVVMGMLLRHMKRQWRVRLGLPLQ